MANTQVVYQNKINDRDRAANAKVVKPARKHFYDYSLLFGVIFAFAMGLLIIFSSSQYMAMIEKGDATYYFRRQLVIGGAGLIGAIIVSKVDYRILKNGIIAASVYIGTVGLLIATLLIGFASHGRTRWINITKGISFQPAEIAKIGVIICTAYLIERCKKRINETRAFLFIAGAAIVPAMLILNQNISSGFIVIFITAVMMFIATRKDLLFGFCFALSAAALSGAKPLIRLIVERTGYTQRPSKYYLRRILGWALPDMYPADAYQTQQGLYAIGSGGLTGRGLGESIQKFGKIPEVQNDMIFTVICEEFGFFGAATVVLVYLFIIYRIYLIARNARDLFGSMICIGVMAHLSIQVILNIAVVTGVIPNTGVTLPFISYGGSAAAFTMIEIGLVLSVSNRIPRD